MASKDNFFKARLTDEQIESLNNIVDRIQKDTPEANVTTSSIARHALEKYISDYMARHNGTALVSNIPIEDLSTDDLEDLDDKLSQLTKEFKEKGKENIGKVVERFNLEVLREITFRKFRL